jgi:hypothetical protein
VLLDRNFNIDLGAIKPDQTLLDDRERHSFGRCGEQPLLNFFLVHRVDNLQHRLPKELRSLACSKHSKSGRIHVHETSFPMHNDRIRRELDQPSIPFFALLNELFRPLPFRDILKDPDDVRRNPRW